MLGMATQEEIRELERLCKEYAEVRQALEEAQETLGKLAEKDLEPIPVGMKASILQSLVEEDLVDANEGAVIDEALDSKEMLIKTPRFNWYALVAATCALLLVVGAIYHFNIVNDLKSKLSALSAQQQSLLVENVNFREELENKKQELSLAASASVQKYNLAGVPGHENNSATLYWDKNTNEVYLLPLNLPALPSGKQYQLWAIVDGKPKNAGVYAELDFNVLQKMNPTERAEMFAITIEKEGGVAEPSLDQMVVAVKI